MSKQHFWQTPEKVTGAIFLTAFAAGFGYLALNYFPPLSEIISNSLYLASVLAALGTLFYLAIEPRARNLLRNAYRSAVRAITGLFIKMDPISVLRSHLDDLAENINELSIQIGQLRGQMRNLNNIIETNNANISKNLLAAQKAERQGDKKELILATRKAGRLKDANKKYNLLKSQMDELYQILTRMYDHAEILHEDVRDQIELKEIEYKAISSSRKAMEGAKNVLTGTKKAELFEQSMKAITESISRKKGEMERFMDMSKNYMDSLDLQNAEFESDGIKMLREFEASILADSEGLDLSQKPKEKTPIPRQNNPDTDNEYEQLL